MDLGNTNFWYNKMFIILGWTAVEKWVECYVDKSVIRAKTLIKWSKGIINEQKPSLSGQKEF